MMFGSLFGPKGYSKISQSEAKDKLTADSNILLLDVRTPQEYREVHIPRSVSLPLDRLQAGIARVAKAKDAEIIVYCLSGARADRACQELSAMGYTNVSTMGGINTWRYETERGR